MSSSSSVSVEPAAVAARTALAPVHDSRRAGRGLLLLAFPVAWLLVFLVIPVLVVVVVSFFVPTLSGFAPGFTLENYRLLAGPRSSSARLGAPCSTR